MECQRSLSLQPDVVAVLNNRRTEVIQKSSVGGNENRDVKRLGTAQGWVFRYFLDLLAKSKHELCRGSKSEKDSVLSSSPINTRVSSSLIDMTKPSLKGRAG